MNGKNGNSQTETRYYSCYMINCFELHFYGRLGEHKKIVRQCCEKDDVLLSMELEQTGEETFKSFKALNEQAILEGVLHRLDRHYTKKCMECDHYALRNWKRDGLVHRVNISIYPAPCQLKCIYCNIGTHNQNNYCIESVKKDFDIVLDCISYATENGQIASDAVWQISSGEISIHSFKDKILELVKGKVVTFYTNCVLYDDEISIILQSNPNAKINLSIDAGTSVTWKKVKGVDNFNDVVDNVVKYSKSCISPNQITLKYILLPGCNTSDADFDSLIEIIKTLGVKHITVSRDYVKKYNMLLEADKQLIADAGRLLVKLNINKIGFDMYDFTRHERQEILSQSQQAQILSIREIYFSS